jgi:O-antigen ligase
MANAGAAAITAGAFLVAILVTFAMAVDIRAGVALLCAIGFAATALASLRWGVALWLMVAFCAGAFPALYAALTAGAILLIIAWLGELIRGGRVSSPRGGLLWVYVLTPLLLVWLLLTVTWAPVPHDVRSEWVIWMRSLAVFFVVVTTLRAPQDLRLLASAFCVGAVLSVVIGLLGIGKTYASVTAAGAVAEGRLTGGAGDPNILAAGLLPALVLAIMLAATARGPGRRAVALLALPLLIVGIVLTQSRGAFVGLIAIIVAGLWFTPGRRLEIGLATLVVVAIAAAALAADPTALARVTGNKDSSSSGRSDLWTVAWRVSEDHPVVGVGLGNYKVVAPDYVRRPGQLTEVNLIADEPHVVHNTYLGLLAESGVIGVSIFLAIVVAAVDAVRRAARGFQRSPDTAWAFAVAVLVSTIGMLTTAFFLSSGADPRLWLLLALGPALLAGARRPAQPALAPGTLMARDLRWTRR